MNHQNSRLADARNRCVYCAIVLLSIAFLTSRSSPAAAQGAKADVIAITAEKLGSEYDADQKAASQKYEGKILEVTGTVKSAMFLYGPQVFLEGSKALYSISCNTNDKQPWARFSTGQKVKVTGKYRTSPGGPQLEESDVVALTPNPAIVTTAETLAKEFEANEDAAQKKYDKKSLIVTGTIVATKLSGSGFTDIDFKGSEKVGVNIRLHNTLEDFGKTLKPGQTLTMTGPFSYKDATVVKLDISFPITKDDEKKGSTGK